MDLSALQLEIGRLLNDPANSRWTADVLTTRINLAQTEIVGYTGCYRRGESLNTSSTIALDADTMSIVRATIQRADGSIYPIPLLTTEQLVFRYPDFAQWDPGEPRLMIYDAINQVINLYPEPDTSNQITGGFSVIEVRKPADLVNSTDIPFESNNQLIPHHMAIVHWVVAQCWMDDGTPEALQKARFHKSGSMLHPGEYEKQLGRIMAEFDSPDAIQDQIMWRPQGGRTGSWWMPNKSNPLPWPF